MKRQTLVTTNINGVRSFHVISNKVQLEHLLFSLAVGAWDATLHGEMPTTGGRKAVINRFFVEGANGRPAVNDFTSNPCSIHDVTDTDRMVSVADRKHARARGVSIPAAKPAYRTATTTRSSDVKAAR